MAEGSQRYDLADGGRKRAAGALKGVSRFGCALASWLYKPSRKPPSSPLTLAPTATSPPGVAPRRAMLANSPAEAAHVRPDYSGLVTFYDPSLSSLVEARYGKDRLHLHLEGISALDTEQVRDELRTVLTHERDGGRGIDWGSIVRVVTERYAGRLEHLRFLP
ncbi:hypothetical protein EDB85DRAFT_2298012 [Lactarius pseudohatsudake]|nr:hypothetical protein EDB85DRAFT_2298012 [Lactarius pseudohatsudake]